MGFYVSPDGSDVTRSLVDEIQNQMKVGVQSGKGYALVSVSLPKEQLNEARWQLWRSLAEHHAELDCEINEEAPETYGIGKVDFLPESCLRLQVMPCFRKIFGHLLRVDADSLVSTFDVPQYVPPGRDQQYMGLSIGKTSVVGLLCLTSQLLTVNGMPISPGTLVLYDTRTVAKHRTILPKNPDDAPRPWLGLRIGFWPSHADKFGIPGSFPSLLRRELFLQGRFGLHFDQSPHADSKEIARRRRDFLQQEADSRFFIRDPLESCTKSVALPHSRQLVFDNKKGMLKWVSQSVEKENRGILQPLTAAARTSNVDNPMERGPLASCDKENHSTASKHKSDEGKEESRVDVVTMCRDMIFTNPMSPLPPSPAKKRKRNNMERGKTGILQPLSAAARTSNCESPKKTRSPRSQDKENRCPTNARNQGNDKSRVDLVKMCQEMIITESLSPLSHSPVKKRKIMNETSVESPEKCATTETEPQSQGEGNAIKSHEYFLTDLVYDSMYEDSDSEISVVTATDYHPLPFMETPDLKTIEFDREVTLHKHIPKEKLGVFKRKHSVQLSARLKLSQFLFCSTGDLGNERPSVHSGPIWNSKQMEGQRNFCTFQSLRDEIYEVRGARHLMDLLRMLVIGVNSLNNKGANRSNSYFSIKELFEVNENLASVPCDKDTLYSIIRVPIDTVHNKNANSYFNLRDYQRGAPRKEWKDVTMTDSALKAIEWNDRARKILGEDTDLFDVRFPVMIGKETDRTKMICNEMKKLCHRQSKAALQHEMPVYCHVLSVEQILDKHSEGVKHIVDLCKAWATTGVDVSSIQKNLARTLREQFQLIHVMRMDKNMSIAYRVYGMSPKELFMQVICTRLAPFKQLVMAVKGEYENQ